MKKYLIIFLILCSCKQSANEAKWQKYRTLWYRTGASCFYDSTRKYGTLYNLERGINDDNLLKVDTIPVNEKIECK